MGIEMKTAQEKTRQALGAWLRNSFRMDCLHYFRVFRKRGMTKRIALRLAKELVTLEVNGEIRRNFEGPKSN